MTSQQTECPPDQSLDDQDSVVFQDWIDQVRQQNQTRADFEQWANQVKAQMLKSLRKK